MANEKRLIDANALKTKVFNLTLYVQGLRFGKTVINNILESYRRGVFEEIDNAPTEDAVEVVRCEKCRYYEKAEYDDGYKMVCRLLKRQTAYNGFCYCGAKMDGDGNA